MCLEEGTWTPEARQDRARAGPDAELWAEANRPGDGARQLSSRSRRKGSPAQSARGRSRHKCQTLEGRKPPLKPEASAPARTRGHVAAAGGAEAGEERRRFRMFLREGDPQGEGENQESGWMKINTNTHGPSGKGHGARSGDCEMNTGVSVNPGRAAILPSGRQLSRPARQGVKMRPPFRGRVLECWTHRRRHRVGSHRGPGAELMVSDAATGWGMWATETEIFLSIFRKEYRDL